MKNYLGKVLCILLCIALVFSIAACSSDDKQKTTLDLGEDDSWDIDDGGAGDSGETDVDTGAEDKEKANQNAQDAVADADSLSWTQLVAKMPAKLRGTTFTMFSWNPVTDVTDADKVVKNFETQTGIKVVWNQAAYEEYDTKLTALINAKKSPDLIRYITPAPARMYLCQDLKSATGYDFKGDIWDSRVMESYSYAGKYYAANLKNTFNQQPTAVVYRPSQIARYKLEDPYTLWKQGKWTYDKFKELCRAFKDETTRCGWMTSRTLDYLWLNNLDLITFDGKKYKNNLSDKNVILGLQEVIANRDDVSPDAASMSDRFADG
ncbi:MAG: carbohydrate ABC transporter substrate-binding protein, partial [Clostridia bacterium]|nr:carbohydrate ABC transporter substrate-binding protein [Clostridia bacterium]